MRTSFRKIEHAQSQGQWHSLGLDDKYTYQWFCEIHRHVSTATASKHTYDVIMNNALLIAQELSRGSISLESAVQSIVDAKRGTCPRSLSQVSRRLYNTANLIWFECLAERATPLVPIKVRSSVMTVDDGDRPVFTEAEVARILTVASNVSPYSESLVQLLFTTGVRIAAVTHLRWSQIWKGNDIPLATVVSVLEKGGRNRILLLSSGLRNALHRLYHRRRKPDDPRVFPLSVRQLRNIFYHSCAAAGISGPHCHPHAARHTVAHALFAAGNPIALIAKFLGHRTVSTTNNYYLRLSFQEILNRIRLPWLV